MNAIGRMIDTKKKQESTINELKVKPGNKLQLYIMSRRQQSEDGLYLNKFFI